MSKDSEQDRLLDHNYDGIQEYDNPLPAWWLWIFYATILYGVLYLLNIPGVGIGKGRIADYERTVAEARAHQAAQPSPEIGATALLAMTRDPAALEVGKAAFTTNCSPCHLADGGGSIGPNLTDDYWIHGGRPLQILKTVEEGVLDKGMPAWGQILKPNEIAAVVAYVMTLHGTHPAKPKAPQGVKEEEPGEEAEEPPAGTP